MPDKNSKRATARGLAVIPFAIASLTMLAPTWLGIPAAIAESEERETVHSAPLLKGGATYCVPKLTPLKLKVATTPSSANDMSMNDRDVDGNLMPAKLNQEITAKLSEDMYVDENKVIPEGTIFYGKVSKIIPPKRASRPGSLEISFDKLKTPDGQVFKFHADADNQHASTLKTKAHGTGIVAAYAAGGAVVGAITAYKVLGLHAAISSHGLTIAGGAAGGALLATGYALMKKGVAASLEPGEELNLRLDYDLIMPAAIDPANKVASTSQNLKGVDIKIKKTKIMDDGLDGHMMRMEAKIVNNSNRTVKSIDLFLEDASGNRSPVTGGLDDEDEFIFEVEPHSTKVVHMYFDVRWPKLKRTIVWVNHNSRQIAYQGACP